MSRLEPGGAGHLVDLLRHVGEQQRHAEVLSKCGFEAEPPSQPRQFGLTSALRVAC